MFSLTGAVGVFIICSRCFNLLLFPHRGGYAVKITRDETQVRRVGCQNHEAKGEKMKKVGIIIVVILISVACNTSNIQPSSQASTPTTAVSEIPIPTITKPPFASPTATLPKVTLTSPSIKVSYQVGIVLDPSLQSGDISIASAWLGYAAARAEWIQTNVSADEIVQKGYHRAFEEEVTSRSSLAKIWKEFGNSQANLKNPYLDDLLKVYESDFIREYTWIYLTSDEWLQPEGLRLDEFSTWTSNNLPNHKPETLAGVEITIDK